MILFVHSHFLGKTPQDPVQKDTQMRLNIALINSLLIWGVFFIKIKMLIVAGLTLAIISIPLAFILRLSIDKIGALVLLNYAFWLLSASFVGSIDFSILASPDYYNGEGRIFVAYIPLILLSVLPLTSRNELIKIVGLMKWVGLVIVILAVLWKVYGLGFLSATKGKHFVGFLTSHTGAGTFFSIPAIFLAVFGIEARKRRPLLLGILSLVAVFWSGSRQALVGIICVGIWYLLKSAKIRDVLRYSSAILLLFFVVLPWTAPQTFEGLSSLFSERSVGITGDLIFNSNWEPGGEKATEEGGTELSAESSNAYSRLLFWAYAFKKFIQSPILGIGFGRFYDFNLKMEGREGLIYMAVDGRKIIHEGNAHNSYLHIMAESGLVGLGLILWLWWSIYQRLGKAFRFYSPGTVEKAYFTASQALVIFTMVGAMFGHGLAGPSVVLPVVTIIGVGVGYHRTTMKQMQRIMGISPGH